MFSVNRTAGRDSDNCGVTPRMIVKPDSVRKRITENGVRLIPVMRATDGESYSPESISPLFGLFGPFLYSRGCDMPRKPPVTAPAPNPETAGATVHPTPQPSPDAKTIATKDGAAKATAACSVLLEWMVRNKYDGAAQETMRGVMEFCNAAKDVLPE